MTTNNQALHLRPAWQKLAARLQHEARKSSGYAIVSMTGILVNANGDPVVWTEPKLTKIEPKAACDMETLIAIFGADGRGF